MSPVWGQGAAAAQLSPWGLKGGDVATAGRPALAQSSGTRRDGPAFHPRTAHLVTGAAAALAAATWLAAFSDARVVSLNALGDADTPRPMVLSAALK